VLSEMLAAVLSEPLKSEKNWENVKK
jgi:hypothetical protein